MTEFELIAVAKNCGNRYTDCSECPLDETEDCLQHLAVQLAERLESLTDRVAQRIVDNTYPGFDKNGKAVNIWNPDGYKAIEKMRCKG